MRLPSSGPANGTGRKPLQDISRTDRLVVPQTSGMNQWQPNSSANERFGVDRDTSSGADRRAALLGCPISTPCWPTARR